MSRWNACRALLDAKMAALPGVTAGQISWPNRAFTKPASGLWYAVAFLPSDVESAIGIGASTHEKGIYQVSIYAPSNSATGMVPVLTAADAVSAHFDRVILGSDPLRVQCSVPVPGPMLVETDLVQIPVSIRFLAL